MPITGGFLSILIPAAGPAVTQLPERSHTKLVLVAALGVSALVIWVS